MQQAVCDGLCQRVQPMIAGRMPRTVQVDIPQSNNRSEDATGVYSLPSGQAIPDCRPAHLSGGDRPINRHGIQSSVCCRQDYLYQFYCFYVFHRFNLAA
jgi:hypothetical protein